jgi:hypothetical protein
MSSSGERASAGINRDCARTVSGSHDRVRHHEREQQQVLASVERQHRGATEQYGTCQCNLTQHSLSAGEHWREDGAADRAGEDAQAD